MKGRKRGGKRKGRRGYKVKPSSEREWRKERERKWEIAEKKVKGERDKGRLKQKEIKKIRGKFCLCMRKEGRGMRKKEIQGRKKRKGDRIEEEDREREREGG